MADPSSPVDSSVAASTTDEVVIEGSGGTSGVAIGTVFQYDASVPEVDREAVEEEAVERELDLLSDAIERAERELDTVQFLARESLDEEGEDIIGVQSLMLQDEELLGSIRERIREHRCPAVAAVQDVLQQYRERLEESPDAHFRNRAGDLVDLEKRLLRSLQHGKVAVRIGERAIVLAENLTATDVLWFSRRGMLGCATEQGGPTSHVSIIAEALGVPTVFGVSGGFDAASSGDPVILDGDEGRLIVRPTAATREAYEERQQQSRLKGLDDTDGTAGPARTADGHAVTLQANVDSESELDLLEAAGAEGIGLVRTELLFLTAEGRMPSEEEQVDLYRKVAEAGGEHGATIRLLDLGADKPFPFGPREENPALGWRGIRILLDRPDQLLRPQIRALLRANRHGSLRVLVPMVAHLEEVRRVRRLMEEEANRLADQGIHHDPDVPLGVMVEVPSVALQAKSFAEEADFFSIGTNDLTQFVLAVDRGNDRVSDGFDALHPAVLRLIRRASVAGKQFNCPVEVCGESAGDGLAVPVLLGLGVDTLSTSPRSVPAMRRIVQEIALDGAHALADDVLTLPDADAVRRRVQEWFDMHVPRDDNSGARDDGSA